MLTSDCVSKSLDKAQQRMKEDKIGNGEMDKNSDSKRNKRERQEERNKEKSVNHLKIIIYILYIYVNL